MNKKRNWLTGRARKKEKRNINKHIASSFVPKKVGQEMVEKTPDLRFISITCLTIFYLRTKF